MSKVDIREEDTNKQENVMLFCDIHGHSINDNIFMYGWKGPEPEDTALIKEIPYTMHNDLISLSQDKFHSKANTANWIMCKTSSKNINDPYVSFSIF